MYNQRHTVHFSNSKNLKIAQMSINKRVNEYTVLYLQSGILYYCQYKCSIATCRDMHEC